MILGCGTKVLTADQYGVKGFGHVIEAVVSDLSEEVCGIRGDAVEVPWPVAARGRGR